jgi:hypothetical protein
MGIPVFLIGKSGSGKSTSLRNFPNDKYSLIEVDGKPLPFKSKKNYVTTDSYAKITELVSTAKSNSIVIDDSQYLMANEFMRRSKETGYQKFNDIGSNFFNLINLIKSLPKEKIVYFLHHEEVDTYGNVTAKTIGKMLDDKVSLEGKFTIVIRAMYRDDEYVFSTKTDGQDTTKTPMEMFADAYIPNDLYVVDLAIREFYGIEEKKETPIANSLI